jgi:hypothetical protein
LSYHIEAKLSESGSPKQLLMDFIPVIKEKLLKLTSPEPILNIAYNLIDGRHLQVYSNDSGVESLAKRLNIDGSMTPAAMKTDFLATVTTSIGGNKSDKFIKTNIEHTSQVARDGSVVNKLTITKKHTWTEDDFKTLKPMLQVYGTGQAAPETMRYIMGGGDNSDYMRIYVPKGSELLSSVGTPPAIRVYEDLGYTVYAFLMGPIPAGGEKTISLTYSLPFKLSINPIDNYKLIIQKQAGSENINLTKRMVTADGLEVTKSYPVSTSAFELMPKFKTELTRNQIFAAQVSSPENL